MKSTFFIEPKIREQINKIKEGFDGLKKLKVIRSNKITGDLGEYYASRFLNLKIVDKNNNKGFDAIDNLGNKYEIKTRLSPNDEIFRTLFSGFSNSERYPFDYSICVNLNPYYEPILIVKFPYKITMKNLDSRKRLTLTKQLINAEGVKILYASKDIEELDWIA